jgi:hypothetical protein
VTPYEMAVKTTGWAGWKPEPTRLSPVRGQPYRGVPVRPVSTHPPQLSVNLIRKLNRGTLVAEAEIVQRGRTTPVVDVRVSDERRQLIARLTATLLAPATPVATASADPTGR